MTLNEMLEIERQRFVAIESAVRQYTPKRWKLPIPPDESEVEAHLTACRCYYEEFGTKFGVNSPWIEAFNSPDHYSQRRHKPDGQTKEES